MRTVLWGVLVGLVFSASLAGVVSVRGEWLGPRCAERHLIGTPVWKSCILGLAPGIQRQ